MGLPDERALIDLLTREAETRQNRAGFASDCAHVPFGERELVVTVDAFAEATHVPDGAPARLAGRLAAGAALSDLAAAGADVLGVLVAYGLPAGLDEDEVQALGSAIAEVVEGCGGEVLGGDTKPREELSLAVTGVGTAPAGSGLTRAQASPGEILLVTGPLGGAGAALARIDEGLDPVEADPLMAPSPRVEAGRALVDRGVACAMDVSDGLADVAVAIAQASGVHVHVDGDAVPLHAWAGEVDRERGLAWALSTGGDYELVASVPEDRVEDVLDDWRRLGLDPARVGRVEEGEGAVLDDGSGPRELSRGYEHTFDQG